METGITTTGYVANAMYDNIRGYAHDGYGTMQSHDIQRDLLKGNDTTHMLIADKFEKYGEKMERKFDRVDDKIEKIGDKVDACCCKTNESIGRLAEALCKGETAKAVEKGHEYYERMLALEFKDCRKNG